MRLVKIRTFQLAAMALALLLPVAAVAQVDTGGADFTRFVTIGDSLGSGFVSGSLIEGAQRNSTPSLIYQQVNGSAAGFEQPLVSSPGIPGILQLQALLPGIAITPAQGNGAPINLNLPRPYDNLSVPGFRMADASQTRTGNPVIDVVLRGLGTQVEQAAFLQPTFVNLWLGNNDVLAAATSGAVVEGLTLTPVAEFEVALGAVGQVMDAVGAPIGAIANLPNVTAIPFVTTLPPVVVDPTGQPVVINGQLVPLIAETVTGVRPLGAGDFVLLTAQSELAQGRGVPPALGGTGPLSTFSVLDRDEVAAVQRRVGELNDVLAAAAAARGAALVDVNTFFDEVAAEGVDLGGIEYGADFLTGGLFSLDGVHPTPLGYAIAANLFLEAINNAYGASIPPVDLGRFVFGSEGRLPGALEPLSAGATVTFSRQAWKSLRSTLDIPSPRQLRKALRQQRGLSREEAKAERRAQRREWRRAARAVR